MMEEKIEYKEETILLKKGQDISDLNLSSGTYLIRNEQKPEEESVVHVDNFLK